MEALSATPQAGNPDPRPKRVRVLQAYLPVLDFASMAFGGIAAGCFTGFSYQPVLPALVAACATSKYLGVAGSYDLSRLNGRARQAAILLSAGVLWFLIVMAAGVVVEPEEYPPATDFALAALAGTALLILARIGASLLLDTWRRRQRFQRKLAIVGLNNVSIALIARLRAETSTNLVISGLYRAADDPPRVTHGGLIVKGGPADLVEHCTTGMHDLILMAVPPGSDNPSNDLAKRLVLTGCDVSAVTDRDLAFAHSTRIEQIGNGVTVAVFASEPEADQSVHKVVFDRCVALILLLVLMPILVAIGVAIRLDSKGPVFFRQPRCGYKNRTFRIFKFRTMYHGLGDLLAERQTTRKDKRVTRVGRWLRWTSLDELPQLINVLTGDMSLVGPRPHALGTRAGQRHLREIVENYPLRHKVKPGITGLAQINGCRGALHSDDQVVRRVAYDMFYIENWSFFFDLKILFLTMFRGFGGANTY